MRAVVVSLGVMVVLFSSVVTPAPAWSATAPATPTFVLGWGSSGAGPAQFSNPVGVAIDAAGDVYVADSGNHRIQKFDYLGNFISQWGSFGSGPGQFNVPYGIAMDPSGNAFVIDQGNNRIQKLTASGNYIAQWGSTGSGPGQFSSPQGIAIDAAGNVYVADAGNSRIQKFTGSGVFVTAWGSLGNGNGEFDNPARVAVDPTGNVYVSDYANDRIQKFTSAGTYLAQWGASGLGNGQFTGPAGITADALGNVYVVEYSGCRVQKFTSAGTYLGQWGSPGFQDGLFVGPAGIAADAAGNLFVVEFPNPRIQKFSGAGVALSQAPPSFLNSWYRPDGPTDMVSAPWGLYSALFNGDRIEAYGPTGTSLGGWGSSGTGNGQFLGPAGIGLNLLGYAYVSEYSGHRIQMFNIYDNHSYVGQWGTVGVGDGQFFGPLGLDVDAGSGDVYVADSGNNRIQKFTATGTYLTQWGLTGAGAGQFNFPVDVAVDASGAVHVVDRNNHRIQKFSSSGAYLTQFGTVGGGNGQFLAPYSIAVGPDRNLYVADHGNHRIQKLTSAGYYLAQLAGFTSPRGVTTDPSGNVFVCDDANSVIYRFVTTPAILGISDVGNDQGRQVLLRFSRCSGDAPNSGVSVPGYEIYRRIEGLPAAATAAETSDPAPTLRTESAEGPMSTELAGWTYLMTVPAHGESEYSVVVPTLADANATTAYYTSYFVRAATSSPFTYFDSGPEYGYSIDNLPPSTPTPFTASYAAGATHLHWGVSDASDFAGFRLYRGATAEFIPGAGNLVAATADTGYADVGPGGSYYKLVAVDRNGNQSPVAMITPNATTDAPDAEHPRDIELAGAFPNPMRAGGSFHYALPRAMPLSLALYDVAGRRVRVLVEGVMPAGAASVRWDGRDDDGRPLPAGLLVLRMAAGARVLTRRVVTLD